jgi:methionine-rich copper-binding protein CopC
VRWLRTAVAVLAGLAGACTAPPAPAARAAGSVLEQSAPAAGETVAGPVDDLRLRFARPVRLDEVIVEGPAGSMPMMVHAAGEVRDYSLPLPGLDPGVYTVRWRATAGGREERGTFSFVVR